MYHLGPTADGTPHLLFRIMVSRARRPPRWCAARPSEGLGRWPTQLGRAPPRMVTGKRSLRGNRRPSRSEPPPPLTPEHVFLADPPLGTSAPPTKPAVVPCGETAPRTNASTQAGDSRCMWAVVRNPAVSPPQPPDVEPGLLLFGPPRVVAPSPAIVPSNDRQPPVSDPLPGRWRPNNPDPR